MRALLTFLILWTGVYTYANTKPHFAPSPKFRYIDLELRQETPNQSQSTTYHENYHYTKSPEQKAAREYSPMNQITATRISNETSKSPDEIIFTPFSSTANEPCPPSQISTKGVDFGGGDIEFGTSDWGDGEEEEPGYDPYPINKEVPFLLIYIIIYGIIVTIKKHKHQQNNINNHEK